MISSVEQGLSYSQCKRCYNLNLFMELLKVNDVFNYSNDLNETLLIHRILYVCKKA